MPNGVFAGDPVWIADPQTGQPLLMSSGGLPLSGNVAHDAVDVGAPIKVGGISKTTAPAASTADGRRVNAWFGRNGQQAQMLVDSTGNIVNANANGIASLPGLSSTFWAGNAVITNAAGVAQTIKAAGGAGVFLYVSALVLSTTALVTAGTLVIRDGSGQQYFIFEYPASGWTMPISIPLPTPLRLTNANQALEMITPTATMGNIRVSATGFTSTV